MPAPPMRDFNFTITYTLCSALRPSYGVVVDSVNVSVLLYAPVRSASLAPMCCWNASVTASLLTGPE